MNNSSDRNFLPKMFNIRSLLVTMCLIIINLHLSIQLECYVCESQEDNFGKCVTTIKTCQQEEDVCLTEVKWGSRPYWSEGALKQFYISKRCSNKEKCKRQREAYMRYCTHIWYEDWRCSECCKGDRCNYYVISQASYDRKTSSIPIIIAIVTLIHRFI